MTLRVTVEIIPFGEENKARTIEILNISNVTFDEGEGPNKSSKYVIEHNDYKNYTDDTPRVFHERTDGALTLIRKALEKLGY